MVLLGNTVRLELHIVEFILHDATYGITNLVNDKRGIHYLFVGEIVGNEAFVVSNAEIGIDTDIHIQMTGRD